MESCLAACVKRARGAVAVLEKLQVGNLIPLEACQQAEWRCDFLPGRVRSVGKRAEEGNAGTLLDGVGDLEIERFPEPLDGRKTSDSA